MANKTIKKAKKTNKKTNKKTKKTINKKSARRTWTAADVREMKSMAKKKAGVKKISKALKRSAGATAVKAHQLGISLDSRG
jgi:hypothetical protein